MKPILAALATVLLLAACSNPPPATIPVQPTASQGGGDAALRAKGY